MRKLLPSVLWSTTIALAMVVGLTPPIAYGQPTESISPFPEQTRTAVSEYAPNEALVIYEDASRARGNSHLLEDAGFSVEQTWDLTVPNAANDAPSTIGLSEAAAESELRIALVSSDSTSTHELIAQLEELDFVEAAAPNYTREIAAATPDDTLYGNLYGLDGNTGINLEAALDADDESAQDNIVAVLDTGVDYTHPDLKGKMWVNPGNIGLPGTHGYDVADNDDDPMPAPYYATSHGTHCAGIIAAQTNNDEGIAGVAQHTKIMALKMSPDSSVSGSFNDAQLIAAYSYVISAALAGENVVAINGSWHVGSYSPVVEYAINQAGKAGVVSVIAAGNSDLDTATSSDFGATTTIESPYAIIVAASNADGGIARFSNWNETDVDLAAPGALMLSTVSTQASGIWFNAETSKQAGKELVYYSDLGDATEQEGFKFKVIDYLTGMPVEDPESVAKLEKDAKGRLTVTFDASGLRPGYYAIACAWQIENPFKGSSFGPQDYAASVNISPIDNLSMGHAEAKLSNLSQTEQYFESVSADCIPDNSQFGAAGGKGTISAINTTDDKLLMSVYVILNPTDSSQPASCTLSGLGIGELANDYVPYGYMSGTSMATPMVAGAFAQLSSLYPDETPLEIRGRIVGGTEKLEASTSGEGETKSVATEGRFSFDHALGDDANANTWGIYVDEETRLATLEGRFLSEAKLSIDGEEIPNAVPAEDGSRLEFTASSELLDGRKHLFVVTDAQTGRIHKATYSMPLAQSEQESLHLEEFSALPVDAPRAIQGELIAGSDRLYYLDRNAEFAYAIDPQDANPAWEEIAPLASAQLDTAANMASFGSKDACSYVYRDGKIHALIAQVPDGERDMVVRESAYDISSDEWSNWREIARVTCPQYASFEISREISPVVMDGDIYYGFTAYETDLRGHEKQHVYVLKLDGTMQTCSMGSTEIDDALPYVFASQGEPKILAFDEDESGAYVASLFSMDADTLALDWESGQPIEGYSFDTRTEAENFLKTTHTATENGVLTTGRTLPHLGDTAIVDLSNNVVIGLGTLGTSQSLNGCVARSAAMFDSDVYLIALDTATDGSKEGGFVYSIKGNAAKSFGNMSKTLSVETDGKGSATVRDWTEDANSSIQARLQDSAVWEAIPQEDAEFNGWYDENGEKVSDEPVLTKIVLADETLTARFGDQEEGDTGGGPGEGNAGPDGTSGENAGANDAASYQPNQGTIPATNDAAPTAAAIALAALGCAALAMRVARRKTRMS